MPPRKETSGDGSIAFGEKILSLLHEASFNTTYKFSVLLALLDLCLEQVSNKGGPPTSVVTPQLAEKVIEIYWPHARPFISPQGAGLLLQGSSGQAEIISRIRAFREEHGFEGADIPYGVADRPDFERLRRQVEWKLVQMPLPRLQRFGIHSDPFIYQIGWDERITRRSFNSDSFDNRLLFVGDAASHLIHLAGLLRPLVMREWTRMIAKLNREHVHDSYLEEFLFGVSRSALSRLVPGLTELQAGRCFYCESPITRESAVDHFIPWSRYADNGIENLVLTDRQCNGRKSAALAATEHVEKWSQRFDSRMASDLGEISSRTRWARDPDRTLGVARALYLNLPEDFLLWRLDRDYDRPDFPRLLQALSG